MFDKNNVPPQLWPDVIALDDLLSELELKIATTQLRCTHNWEKIYWRDPNYAARADHQDLGRHDVIKEYHCPTCNAHKPFKGFAHQVCFKCGGRMYISRYEQSEGVRILIHKCEDCGHEHDTT